VDSLVIFEYDGIIRAGTIIGRCIVDNEIVSLTIFADDHYYNIRHRVYPVYYK